MRRLCIQCDAYAFISYLLFLVSSGGLRIELIQIHKFIACEQNLSVSFPAIEFVLGLDFFGILNLQVPQGDIQFPFIWGATKRSHVSILDLIFRFRATLILDPIRKGFRLLDHEWAVEYKELLLRNGCFGAG